jgi:hypothetical protein
MLWFPLRGKRLFWLLLMSAAAMLFQRANEFSHVLAMGLGALWWLMAFKLASDALLDTAFERERGSVYSVDGNAARQVALAGCLLGLVWGIGFVAGTAAQLVACAALSLALPAMATVLVMEGSLLRAIDPVAWFRLLGKVGSPYLVLTFKLIALAAALALAFVFLVAPLPPWLGTTVMHFLAQYALLAAYHAMGALVRAWSAYERPAAMAAEAPPADADVDADVDADALLMRESERLVATGRADEAANLLERHIHAHGASAAVHSRYRELLTGLDDKQGLLRHSHEYVAVLLGQGKDREAMALYLAARAMYGEFELEDAAQLRQLIAVALRNQQDKLAAALAEEFARRFPAQPQAARAEDIIDVEPSPATGGRR